ncbi:MAG TPA: prolipoprotein diacylglyceryl transferase [Bacillota bacterium]|nr:prolipoprotein diacylglyceryl transferase [Clostridiales bacterium]HPT85161.1 prolipoprotein diacylglyceryl transferase [Bacillota bacterium]
MSSRNLESYISFPGLGIGEFKINSVAIKIGSLEIVWYGILITLGIVAAVCYVLYRARQEKVSSDDVLDLAIYVVLAGLVGARLYYVLTNLPSYIGDTVSETLMNIAAIWKGGLAIYGGIIGGSIAAALFIKIKKLKIWRIFDMLGPATMLGQIIGRWGNFTNAEAYGEPTTLPWRMGIRNKYHPQTIYVHPTFLYESLWNLIGFIIINLLYKKKKFDGQILLMYLAWYGFGRMFIEGLRTDSLYVGDVRISQLVAFVSFVVATALLIVMSALARRGRFAPTAFMKAAEAPGSQNAGENASEPTGEGEADGGAKEGEGAGADGKAGADDAPADGNSDSKDGGENTTDGENN